MQNKDELNRLSSNQTGHFKGAKQSSWHTLILQQQLKVAGFVLNNAQHFSLTHGSRINQDAYPFSSSSRNTLTLVTAGLELPSHLRQAEHDSRVQ